MHFEDHEIDELRDLVLEQLHEHGARREDQINALTLRMENVRARLSRLVDAYTDGMVDKELFTEKKLALLMEQRGLQEQREQTANDSPQLQTKLDEILEQLKSLESSFEYGNTAERRDFLSEITSNIEVDGKNIAITLHSPFREFENTLTVASCGHDRNKTRMLAKEICALLMAPGALPIASARVPRL